MDYMMLEPYTNEFKGFVSITPKKSTSSNGIFKNLRNYGESSKAF